jgi:2'-5' RNA ligase
MKRLFIGVQIESETALRLVNLWRNDKQLNQNRLKWANPDTWHITLHFLADTSESEIDLLQQLIDESFGDVVNYETELIGIGIFPHERNPKVLWLGIKNLQPLMESYERLGNGLRKNGFAFDAKPLKPHLTLARIKSLENRISFDDLMSKYRQFNFGIVAINRVILFESLMTTAGPVYKPLFVKELS